ncbi:MAG: ankyrin repeat domain-containing protein, partial [Planctomycetes bacterium]|nr:ankyrin repeat domain-containing protein [Planctomycetota bacterium]MCC8115998.1 ankyrin repeat domain-containing protein [Planctomycetota bacterium]
MAHEHAHLPDDQRAAAGGTGTDPLATIDDEDIEIVEGMGEEVPVPDAVAAWFREQPIGFGQVTGTGDNLLHLAAADGRVDVLEWLLDAGVDPRTVDYAGEDALTLA